MRYRYKMIQVPPTIAIAARTERGNEAAIYLGRVVNEQARNGWEFYRVDSIGVQTQAGCFGILAGAKPTTNTHYVVTFRREERLPDLPPGAEVE